jgi:hypothetical protein
MRGRVMFEADWLPSLMGGTVSALVDG